MMICVADYQNTSKESIHNGHTSSGRNNSSSSTGSNDGSVVVIKLQYQIG